MTYDDTNIFARILRGELLAHKIHEDAETLAFMDIMPRADGHSLIIPKLACRNTLDATPQALAACMVTVQRVAKAAMAALGAGGVKIEQYNESIAGQVVFHLHFHVLPCWPGVALRPPGKMGDPEAIKSHAEKLRKALA